MSHPFIKKSTVVAAAIGLSTLVSASARANSIFLVPTAAPTYNGTDWTYTYSAELTNDSSVRSGTPSASYRVTTADGDYFNIFDIPGYVAGSATQDLAVEGGGNWQITATNPGFQPDTGATFPDAQTSPTVNFQYLGGDGGLTGPQTIYGSALPPDPEGVSGAMELGDISFESTYGPGGSLEYVGQDFFIGNNTDAANQNFVAGPVPEPATFGLLAMGGVMLLSRRRRKA